MRILAICGSLQKSSGNRALLDEAARRVPGGVTVERYEGLAELPHFDPDLEANGTPPTVAGLRRALAASDAVLIACPEYGHSLPGALKNAIDWVIGSGELERKLVAITASVPHSERGRRGLGALRQALAAVSAQVAFDEPIVRGEGQASDLDRVFAALVAAASAAQSE